MLTTGAAITSRPGPPTVPESPRSFSRRGKGPNPSRGFHCNQSLVGPGQITRTITGHSAL